MYYKIIYVGIIKALHTNIGCYNIFLSIGRILATLYRHVTGK